MFMLRNLSVISLWIFPQYFFFFISGAKSKNNLSEPHQKKFFFDNFMILNS